MEIKKNRIVTNTKGCGIKTSVKSIRAENEFWDNCERVASQENTNKNELIVRVVEKYCRKMIKSLDK